MKNNKIQLYKERLYRQAKKVIDECNVDEINIDLFIERFRYLITTDISRHKKGKHTTTVIDGINIDYNISELIKLIWECGINTENSCENNVPQDYIWIQFSEYDDYLHFMQIVVYYCGDEDIVQRSHSFPEHVPGAWIHTVHPPEMDDPMYPNFSVRFPVADKQFVVNQLKDWLKEYP